MDLNCPDENEYPNYDDRPIRPMDQEALNEALARLPILIDENQSIDSANVSFNSKVRRQPVLAYSTRRKTPSAIKVNQTILNVQTPLNSKEKFIQHKKTPIVISSTKNSSRKNKNPRLETDTQRELNQLKEDKLFLEEMKINLEFECSLLKKTHEEQLELIKNENQREIDRLNKIHQNEIEEMKISLENLRQIIHENNIQMTNLREENSLLINEKEMLNKIVSEYKILEEKFNENETTIKNLRDELNEKKCRTPLKSTKIDRTVTKPLTNVLRKDPIESKTKLLTNKTKINSNSSTEKFVRPLRPKLVK